MKRLMSRSDVVIAVWGLILLVLWIVTWAPWHPDWEAVVLLGAAVLLTWMTSAWVNRRTHRGPVPDDVRPVPAAETTHATSLAGIGIVCAALGLEFGPWLLLVAAGLLLAALAGWVRERRAARQLLEVVRRAERLEEEPRR